MALAWLSSGLKRGPKWVMGVPPPGSANESRTIVAHFRSSGQYSFAGPISPSRKPTWALICSFSLSSQTLSDPPSSPEALKTLSTRKYSDDTAIVACVKGRDESEYRELITRFTSWSRENGLMLNTSKTKEMIIDFGRKPAHQAVIIDGEKIEVVDTYKYLGVHLTTNWTGQSRLGLCIRKDRSVVASAVFFGVVCWGGSMTTRDGNRLDKLIKKCASVIGKRVDSVGAVLEKRMRALMQGILDNPRHPLHDTMSAQRSTRSDRFLSLRCRTARFNRSFVPSAIRLFNRSA
ncbi:hypothetical protein WMY93_021718 [Mugilogobius chulae]|uniref:Reverse transcriptase domain-containing protein n=1 Tax=Mugilogobius chulae TaxID=88201 RepID=A0AAW0NBM6_9GOBI